MRSVPVPGHSDAAMRWSTSFPITVRLFTLLRPRTGALRSKVFGNGIVAVTAPRMAAAKSFRGEPASANRAMTANGIRSINRTRGRKAASARGTKERAERGRNHHAVKSHQREQDVLTWIHLSSPAWRSVARTSRSTPAKSFSFMELRATSTRSSGSVNSC